MDRVTLKQVAKSAGVSPSSVSRYVNNPHSVKPIPALRIEKAIRELGYIPNTFAQGLKRGQTNIIGVVVPVLGPFYARICGALSDFFYQNQHLLFICETGGDPERERYYINALIGQQAAGIVVANSGRNDEFLRELGTRYDGILLLSSFDASVPYDAISDDNVEDAYLLTRHMIEQGHRQFILLLHNRYSGNMLERYQGAKRAFEEAGLDIGDMYLRDVGDTAGVERALSELLPLTPKATAILAYSPFHLESCVSMLNRRGVRIPADVALGGYALEDFDAKYNLNLPSVIQQPYEMGVQAGDILLRRLKRKGEGERPKAHFVAAKLNLP